jgi:hypothetical protein
MRCSLVPASLIFRLSAALGKLIERTGFLDGTEQVLMTVREFDQGLVAFRVALNANGVFQPMASCCSIRIYLPRCAGLALALLAQPALAGPPFVSDDPEPTPDRHFEIYTFNNGAFGLLMSHMGQKLP